MAQPDDPRTMRERMLAGDPCIADDTVVGAGAVVTGDLSGDAVAVGSPAPVVREVPTT